VKRVKRGGEGEEGWRTVLSGSEAPVGRGSRGFKRLPLVAVQREELDI